MTHADTEYLTLAKKILEEGTQKGDRTGTGTISLFGAQMRFDLSKGFPLLTTKSVPLRLVAEELFWFLAGSTDAAELAKKNVHIWTPDAYRWYKEQNPTDAMTYDEFAASLLEDDNEFNLGPIYGKQWRSWNVASHDLGKAARGEFDTIDQITNVIKQIKTNPDSRRLIVSAWNPGDLTYMALPPCHILFQFYVADGKLSCQLYQR